MKNQANLVAIITPQVWQELQSPSSEYYQQARLCAFLEIRYDLFSPVSNWPLLAEQLRQWFPQQGLLGTIRLVRDGGKWPDAQVAERGGLWGQILRAKVKPDWIDVEWNVLAEVVDVLKLAQNQGVKILASEHDFTGIPTWAHLQNATKCAAECGAQGFKIAATAQQVSDADLLYQLISEKHTQFELLAAFAMGAAGRESRVRSLQKGANLGYAALGAAVAPGLLSVTEMQKALTEEWE